MTSISNLDTINGRVISVSKRPEHNLSKEPVAAIHLITGIGVEGDAHAGKTVKHRSRVKQDPTQPNLRQVHLIHAEIFDELAESGFHILPGQMGENVTTQGIPLLELPRGTRLWIGSEVCLSITGLRNPCNQLDGLKPGLMQALVFKQEDGTIIRKAGIMSIVHQGGWVRPGDEIRVELPHGRHIPLDRV